MLTDVSISDLPAFTARMDEQWARVAKAIPGLQFIRSGERGSQCMLVCSIDDFYEGVVIGQLEHVAFKVSGPPHRLSRKAIPNASKPVDKRGFEFSPAQIDSVINAWRHGDTAKNLPFVVIAVDRDGRML